MDTILKFIRGPFKKGKVTVNPNQDVEKVQKLTDDQINQELQELDKEELTPSEEEREDILLGERRKRWFNAEFNTKEAKERIAKEEQYSADLRERVAETPNPFQEYQKVRLKTSSFPKLSEGSEGVILDVLPPALDENGVVRYEYVLEAYPKHPETSQIMGISIWTVYDDQLEAI